MNSERYYYIILQGLRMGAGFAGTHAPDRKIYISGISIYQVYNTSSVE